MLMPTVLRTALLSVVLIGSAPAISVADGYDDGMLAYTAGQYDQAIASWTALAEEGHPRAQFNLAYMYEFGIAVPTSSEEAVKWYRRSAEQGYARAQNFLGWMYEMGKGVTHDRNEALKWLRKAADQGSDDALADFRLVAKRAQRNQELAYKQELLDLINQQLNEAEKRYDAQQHRSDVPRWELEASNPVI